ncbi:hypothetical protein [Paraliobacillus salinarum]|uniref:hypothetical protein n=1 Tax=Paraliobacillus salinarum TaxID=1158996 RepID=UPI0015F4A4E2|nr:hypothetical protein [Paraliobacillus salinarum]
MNDQQFAQLQQLVKIGEEINFDYNDEEYWISHTPDGLCHLTRVTDSFTQTFNNVDSLFNNAKLKNKNLNLLYPYIQWMY